MTGEKTWGLSAWRRHRERRVFPGGFHSDAEAIAIQMFDISLRLPGLNIVPYGARATCACSGWLLTSPGPGAGGKLEPTVPPRGPRQKQAELASAFCSVQGPISFSLSPLETRASVFALDACRENDLVHETSGLTQGVGG